jgi:hypothetical protein
MWKKYGTAGQATDDNIIQRMRFACWITKAADTHSELVTITYRISAAKVFRRTRLKIPFIHTHVLLKSALDTKGEETKP